MPGPGLGLVKLNCESFIPFETMSGRPSKNLQATSESITPRYISERMLKCSLKYTYNT
jgi:hypothetical protein